MSSHRRAIEFVAAKSTGVSLDPDLRVTLNFHPDRTSDGVPILVSLAADGFYHRHLVETMAPCRLPYGRGEPALTCAHANLAAPWSAALTRPDLNAATPPA